MMTIGLGVRLLNQNLSVALSFMLPWQRRKTKLNITNFMSYKCILYMPYLSFNNTRKKIKHLDKW